MQGSVVEILLAAGTTAAAVCFLAVACVGYLMRSCNWAERGVFLAASILMILPPSSATLLAVNGAGLAIGLAAGFFNFRAAAGLDRGGAI